MCVNTTDMNGRLSVKQPTINLHILKTNQFLRVLELKLAQYTDQQAHVNQVKKYQHLIVVTSLLLLGTIMGWTDFL